MIPVLLLSLESCLLERSAVLLRRFSTDFYVPLLKRRVEYTRVRVYLDMFRAY